MGLSGRLDHLVVVARDLDQGVAWAETRLGAALPDSGGTHPLMGTRNRLMRLDEASFLEVIAPDPGTPAPSRPRWFGLDTPPPEPRLAHWLVRVPGLRTGRAALPPENGAVLRQRRGNLSWLITVPEDGSLPFDGIFPSFLDWETEELSIPPRAMPGGDFSLVSLELAHPEAAHLSALLKPVLDDPRLSWVPARQPALRARLQGPAGPVELSGTAG